MLNEELRKLAIGGSEIGAVLGIDPDRNAFAVWADKRGGLTRMADRDRPQYMLLGRMLEEGVLHIYEHMTGRETAYCNDSRIHPERPWMVWTPDGLCRRERRGVDAKVVRWDQGYKWGETSDDIPPRIIAQCWWYMAAADYEVWDVIAVVGCQDVRIYQIDRDHEAEREMLFRAQEFYRRYLIGDERPPVEPSRDADRWLKQMFPKHRVPIREANDTEAFLLDEYSRVRLRHEGLGTVREALETRLKMIVADAEGLAWPAGRITYRAAKDGVKTDWERLANSLMGSMTAAERKMLVGEHSKEVPGSRRFLWDCDASLIPPVLSDAASAELLQERALITAGAVPEQRQLIELVPPAETTMAAPMKSVRELLAEQEEKSKDAR